MWNPEVIGIGIQNPDTWNKEYNTALDLVTWGELVAYYRHFYKSNRIEKTNVKKSKVTYEY